MAECRPLSEQDKTVQAVSTKGTDCPSDSGRQGPSGLGLAPLEDQFKDNETRETKPNPVHFRQGLPK